MQPRAHRTPRPRLLDAPALPRRAQMTARDYGELAWIHPCISPRRQIMFLLLMLFLFLLFLLLFFLLCVIAF